MTYILYLTHPDLMGVMTVNYCFSIATGGYLRTHKCVCFGFGCFLTAFLQLSFTHKPITQTKQVSKESNSTEICTAPRPIVKQCSCLNENIADFLLTDKAPPETVCHEEGHAARASLEITK